MENPIKMDDLGGKNHYFWKHRGNTHLDCEYAKSFEGSVSRYFFGKNLGFAFDKMMVTIHMQGFDGSRSEVLAFNVFVA